MTKSEKEETKIVTANDSIPFEDEPKTMRKCKFFNLIDQGHPIEFKYGRVVRNRADGKVKTVHEAHRFEDQEIVTVPDYIAKHINSLVIPERRYEKNKSTGAITHIGTGTRNRCTLTEV